MGSCEDSGGGPSFVLLPVIVAGELSALGVGDGNDTVDCSPRAVVSLDKENIVEENRLECELLEPLSSLDITLQVAQSERGSAVVESCFENDGCLDDGNVVDRCERAVECLSGDITGGSAVGAERKSEQICRGIADGATERDNVSGIECVLNRMSFDEALCKSEIDLYCANVVGEYEDPSEAQEVVDARIDSVEQDVTDCDPSGHNFFAESVTEVVSNSKHDGPPMSLIMSDKSIPEFAVEALNVDQIGESFNHEQNIGNGSLRIEDDRIELNWLYSPLSLRRSSRSRKTVQKVERGKNAIQISNKPSKLTLNRTTDFFSKATRKKRSCLSRSVCSSGWGLSAFSKYFERSKELSEKQVVDEGKPEKKTGQRSRRKNTIKVVPSSQLVEEKQALPYRPIRLKVTFGKKEEHINGLKTGIDDHISVPVSNTVNTSGKEMDDPVAEEMRTLVQCGSSASKDQFKVANLDTSSVSGKSSHSDSFQPVEPGTVGNAHPVKFLDPGTSPDSEVIDSSVGTNLLLNNSEKVMPSSFSVPLSDRCPSSSKSSKNKRSKKGKPFGVDSAGVECQHSSQKAEKSKKDETWQKSNDNFGTDGTNPPNENLSSNTTGSGSELVLTELKAPSLDNGADSNLSRKMIAIESTDSGSSNHLLTPETEQKKNSKASKIKGKLKNQPKVTNAKKNRKEPSGQRKGNKKLANKPEVRDTAAKDDAHQDKGQPGADNLKLVAVQNTNFSSTIAPQNLSCLALPPNVVGEQTLPPRVAWVCCDECEKWRCIPAKLADVIEETNVRWTCKDNQDQIFADCSIPQEKSNADINTELQISDDEEGRYGHLGSKGSGNRPPGDPQQSTWMIVKSNLFLHRRRKTQTMDEIMVCHCKPPADGTLGCGSQCLNRMLNIECVQGTCPCGDICSNQQFQQRSYANLSWFRSGRKGYGLQVLEDISEGKFLIEYVGEVLDLQSYEARQKDYASKGHKHFYFMTLNGNEVIDACSKGNLGRFVNHSCDPNCRTEKWVVNGEICVGLFALKNIRKGEELTFDYNYVRVFGAAAKKCYCGSFKCRGYIGGDPLNAEVVIQGDSDEEFPEPVAVNESGELDHSLMKIMVDRPCSQDAEHTLKGDTFHEQNSAEVAPDVSTVKALEECLNDVISQSTDLAVVDEVYESSNRLATSEADKEKNEPIAAVQLLNSTPANCITSSTSSKSDVLPIESEVSKSVSGSVDSSDKMSELVITEGEQPLSGSVDSSDKMSALIIAEGERPLSKSRHRMKISRPSKSTKNRKASILAACLEKALFPVQPLRSQVLPFKPKKLLEGSANGHLEGVEGKLNELLDSDGGICKKKDASKGYLKLLLLTAASGDSSNGGAIQSNRELSMILDAVLKTKSRGVLLDIISKNGLQMLHNMMKLYRKDFKKTPILRKLLKVLEFLAEKEILSVERIIGDSLRPGVESFRESILNLTEHEDKKVHQIARNFRDRWIPRPLRNRYNVMDDIDRMLEYGWSSNCNRFSGSYHPRREHGARVPESVEIMKQSPSVNNCPDTRTAETSSPLRINFQTITSRQRKRKSRWDQPADPGFLRRCTAQRIIEPFLPVRVKTSPKAEGSKGGKQAINEEKHYSKTDDVMENSEDDLPPGFSCLQNHKDAPPGFSSSLHAQNLCSMEYPSVSVGSVQNRFNPRIPVAYGIPFSVLQQFGVPESRIDDTWSIAPAFPFKPFPPLPPCPRVKKARLHPSPDATVGLVNHLSGDAQQFRASEPRIADTLPIAPFPVKLFPPLPPYPRVKKARLNPSPSEDAVQVNHLQGDAQRGLGMPSTSGPSLPPAPNHCPAIQDTSNHGRGSWNGPGRRHQKQKNQRPPWFRNLDGRGVKANHPRNRVSDRNTEIIPYEQNAQHLADVNQNIQCAGNSW